MAAAVAAALSAGACQRTEPIQSVENRPITGVTRPLTADQVERAIAAAGVRRGWVFTRVAPGLLRGTHTDQGHSLVLDVPYTASTYSIRVNSSVGLRESDGTIHRTANRWIRNLQQDIDAELARASLASS
jgi:hypothetical protein